MVLLDDAKTIHHGYFSGNYFLDYQRKRDIKRQQDRVYEQKGKKTPEHIGYSRRNGFHLSIISTYTKKIKIKKKIIIKHHP